jgi:hypothetical protein
MTIAAGIPAAGEGRATYENVYAYLLAHCVVTERLLEAGLGIEP